MSKTHRHAGGYRSLDCLILSWLVVARGASARVRLVGHLGWVHQHEARPVGEPHERMGGRR